MSVLNNDVDLLIAIGYITLTSGVPVTQSSSPNAIVNSEQSEIPGLILILTGFRQHNFRYNRNDSP